MVPQFVKGRGRGAIAGDHHGGGTFADQVAADRKRPLTDRTEAALAVWSKSLVSDIDQWRIREQRSNLAQYTESADTRVEDTDRLVGHPVSPWRFR